MRSTLLASIVIAAALTLSAPAGAAEDGATPSNPISDAAALLVALTGLVTAGGAAAASWRKAQQAEASAASAQAEATAAKADAAAAKHEAEAMRDAMSHFGAHRQAVGVVLNLPGQTDRGVFDYMTQTGWSLAPYTAHGGAVPTDPRFWADLAVADVLIVQGATKEEALALAPLLAERVPQDGGVILYNESGGVLHAFKPWGPSVQGATTIGTTDLWARAMYSRRSYMAAYQGAERGSLAAQKAERQGAVSV